MKQSKSDPEHQAMCKGVATVLKRIRVEAKKSQQDLALDAGVDRTYLSLLERGRQQPSPLMLVRLAKALGQRPEDFFSDVMDAYAEALR